LKTPCAFRALINTHGAIHALHHSPVRYAKGDLFNKIRSQGISQSGGLSAKNILDSTSDRG